jgi:hypothetical protein
LEIGFQRQGDSDGGDPQASWVKGRQTTGRIVSLSNKLTFTDPVFNYSAAFSYIWEELTLPVPYRDDWRRGDLGGVRDGRADDPAGARGRAHVGSHPPRLDPS